MLSEKNNLVFVIYEQGKLIDFPIKKLFKILTIFLTIEIK